MIATTRKEMKQSFETLTNQLSTTSNAEVKEFMSNLSTMVEHLSSKVSTIEGHLASIEETTIKRLRQCEELCNSSTMARNDDQEQMTLSLQKLTVSNKIAGACDVERKKDVDSDFVIL
jgi:hypothetical protein